MIALAKLKDHPFDVVVAWSTSRFGRNQDEAIFNKIGLRRQGVEVKFVSQPVPDGHIGTLIERIYEWKDEFDSIQIGEYVFEGQKEVTSKGFHAGGKAPYGYRRKKVADPDGKTDREGNIVEYVTYEVFSDEAVIVRRIFDEYASGGGAAAHYGYDVTTVHGDMRDLSSLHPSSFDIVYGMTPCYVPSIQEVYIQVARVMRPGGLYRTDAGQPGLFAAEWDGDGYRYRIGKPYCESVQQRDDGAVEYRHYLDDIFNGLSGSGLTLLRVDDRARYKEPPPDSRPGSYSHENAWIGGGFVIFATKAINT